MSAFSAKAVVIRRKTDIDFLRSAFAGKPDVDLVGHDARS